MNATDTFRLLDSPERHAELKERVERIGYDAFRPLIDLLVKALKEAEEPDFGTMGERLAVLERLFPEPASFSPTWQNVWKELQEKLRWKRHAYDAVPAKERSGEWQILMDNPFTNQEIVCYPSLSFVEASYLFCYFKPTLEKTEYLRLQKVVTAVQVTGQTE
ncbi:hypothetical protein MO973_18975 [Paenibacillus sp. TRM 82003]|nr:hypothetical protein [Paenibacillus sp. TRM 82003]